MAAKLCKEQQTLFGNDMTYIWILLMVRKRSAKLGLKRTLIFKKTSRAVKNFADIFYFNFIYIVNILEKFQKNRWSRFP